MSGFVIMGAVIPILILAGIIFLVIKLVKWLKVPKI